MLINQLSKQTGVSIHTLRFYENTGLITGTTDISIKSNNYKEYDETHVEKVGLIREAKEAGFTLAEIKKMIDGCYGGTLTMKDKLKLVDNKIAEIDAKIDQLKQVKKRLRAVRKEIENGEC